MVLFPKSPTLGSSFPAEGFESYRAFVLELILTFFLMVTIMNISTGSKEIGTIAVGGIILLEAMFAGPMTKASMNPVRSLAPAVVSGNLPHIWLYLTALFIGAILGVLSWKLVKSD